MWQDLKDFITGAFFWALILGFSSGFFVESRFFTAPKDKVMEDAYKQNYKFIDKTLQDDYKSWLNRKIGKEND